MESPRAVNRFLLAILGVYSISVIAASIYYRNFSILFYSAAVVALAVPAFGVLGLLYTIIFAPIFWLMARLGPKAKEFSRRAAKRAEK